MIIEDLSASGKDALAWLNSDHLSGLPEEIVNLCEGLAEDVIGIIPRGKNTIQLEAGLQKLVEAKDCFVRASFLAGT